MAGTDNTGKLEATPALIRQKAQEFQQQHDAIMGHIKALKAEEDHLSSMWDGAARNAFNSFMERYYFQADKMNDKLAQTGESLLQMSNKFEDSDLDFSTKVNAQVSSLDLPAV
jgi:WXG100 family type VII secretion target